MFKGPKIQIWINLLQVLITLIMLQQVYTFVFDHAALIASGITANGVPDLNLFYEFAGRTAAAAIISIVVLINKHPHQF